ncbi:MAG: Do family serine endopeptidase [Acidobacteria bacterium]|nr:Do family serine endopeptidase [Acidobacteriota bacterium]
MASIGFKSKHWARVLGGIIILVAGALVGSVMTASTSWLPFGQNGDNKVPIYVSANTSLPSNISLTDGLAPIARAVRESVVSISSTKVVRTQPHPFFDDPFFRRFFGRDFDQSPREMRETALGSGVIVSPDGYILTNKHVVEGASELKITFADKREMDAKIIGTDSPTDVAVIKVNAKDLSAIPLGDSQKVQVGDFVLAVGNPFGLGHTFTFGIVSATGRAKLGIPDVVYQDFIQTDAAINQGNSGGALVNMRGELVGINTAIFSQSGGNIGIGFAIPINMAREVMDQILRKGKVIRGYLGLLPQDLTPAIAEKFGVKGTKGALVGNVEPDAPAANAGIQRGDIILEFNGHEVKDADLLRNMVAETPPGTTAKVKLFRDGQERTVEVKLGERPDAEQARSRQELGRENALSGIEVEDLTPSILGQLNLPRGTQGVVVTDVDPGSSAAEEDIGRGNIIQEIDRQPIANVSDFRRAAARAEGKDVLVLVLDPRSGMTRYVVLKPRK